MTGGPPPRLHPHRVQRRAADRHPQRHLVVDRLLNPRGQEQYKAEPEDWEEPHGTGEQEAGGGDAAPRAQGQGRCRGLAALRGRVQRGEARRLPELQRRREPGHDDEQVRVGQNGVRHEAARRWWARLDVSTAMLAARADQGAPAGRSRAWGAWMWVISPPSRRVKGVPARVVEVVRQEVR